ncbi:PS_pyruv_trans domain-containing protein (plasmid) [Rhodovastum atsumiense]|nr:PS_pyruv_trans domain-containing protein [Rhodovastum atsumiense]
MLGFLRQQVPQARLRCIAVNPEAVRRDHGIAAIPIGAVIPFPELPGAWGRSLTRVLRKVGNWAYAVRQMSWPDLLLIPGTGILDDFSTGPWGVPYALFRWCLIARLRGVRIAFISIGAGPICHPLSRWFMKSAARLAHYRSYRDEISRDYMRSIGFSVQDDPIYPDIAFRLPDPPLPAPSPDGTGLVVGVGVMAYYGWANNAGTGESIYQTYIGKVAQFVCWLLESGHRVRLLMGETADARAVGDVLRSVASLQSGFTEGRISAEPATSLRDVMSQVAATDIVVATRFHNVVCALKLGKPTLSLSYARKNDVLLAEMGLGTFCQPVEDIDLDRLKAQFGTLVAGRDRHRQQIQDMVAHYSERLQQQEEILLTRLIRR